MLALRRAARERLIRALGRELGGALALFAGLLVLVAATPSPAQRRARSITLPVAVTVAEWQGTPVVADGWIDAQVESANAIFGAHGVSFRVVTRERMDERHARLEVRPDRHALGALLHPRVIDCFLVLSLRDVDDPTRYRQGVHWRPRGAGYGAGAHLVIVSSVAGPTVLAHELGHYFGNGHSRVSGNIMSYQRGDVAPFFDQAQARRIQTFIARFLRDGELTQVREPRGVREPAPRR